MNSPILLIIQREFLSRIRKKSFLLITILGPLAFAALLIIPGIVASIPEHQKNIIVLDESALLRPTPDEGKIEYTDNIAFIVPNEVRDDYRLKFLIPLEHDLTSAKELFMNSEFDAFLYIPTGENWDPDWIKNNIKLIGKNKEVPSIKMAQFMDRVLEDRLNTIKLRTNGVDPDIVRQSLTQVQVESWTLDDQGNIHRSATRTKMALGYISGVLIYFFIFFYAVMVMRGIIEEKSNRIVEVIISSVRPFQLMMGKILGIGAVGIVQFIIWVLLSGGAYLIVSHFVFPDLLAQQAAAGVGPGNLGATQGFQIFDILRGIDFSQIIWGFLFYFFGGYFLYSSLFAAVGAAIDREAESQQYILPVTIPMLIALVTASNIIQDPNGPLAFWMSMIPFTAPISMMIRMPFYPPLWEVILSGTILIVTFFAIVLLSSRIYRTGILMYGKKVTLKEMYKWLRH
jgi:ABC-2 type transport system permease protein